MGMMLSCKEASRRMSEGLDRKLSLTERLGLRFHLAMCEACNRVQGQLHLLRRAVSQVPGSVEGTQDRRP